MLSIALCIAAKDLRLIVFRGAGILQALLLGLLLIFIFSLSQPIGELVPAQTASTIFWLASLFCLVLASAMCHGTEDAGTRAAMLLSDAPPQAVWLGKALAVFGILLATQMVFFPAAVAFLNQPLAGFGVVSVLGIILVDIGLAAAGALFGALGQGRAARESLVSILLFPMLVPVLLAGIRLTVQAFSLFPDTASPVITEEMLDWLGIAAAFDAVLVAAGLVLFQFVFTGEE